jgi:predicted permease
MKAARQQRGTLSFEAINVWQRPLAWLAELLLPLIAFTALRQARTRDVGEFASFMALAIFGNAAVFGLFATAHNRYGARIIWLAAFAAALALACAYERRTASALTARDILPA